MRLVIAFEVPDGQIDAYADIADRLIKHHAFAVDQKIEHWSFHQEMRPVAAAVVEDPAILLEDMVGAADTMAALLQG